MIAARPEEFIGGWTLAGTKQFITYREPPASHGWLVNRLTALEGQDRNVMLAGVEAARSTFQTSNRMKQKGFDGVKINIALGRSLSVGGYRRMYVREIVHSAVIS